MTAGSIVSPKRMVPPHPFPFAPILAGIIEKRKHQQIERQTRVSTWIPRDLAGVKGKRSQTGCEVKLSIEIAIPTRGKPETIDNARVSYDTS